MDLKQNRNDLTSAKVAAILPAYEAAATLEGVLDALPREYFQYIILVDDCSKDQTFEIASRNKSILVYRNEKNLGYGGNVKRGMCLALEHGADIIIEIHPDGEYGLESIGAAIDKIKQGADLVLGNRFFLGKSPLKSGMYFWKYPFVKLLNGVGNWALGTNLGDLHQGFRVYSSRLLKNIDFMNNSDNYIFSFQIIVQAVFKRYGIQEVPQSCRYSGEKRGARLLPAAKYTIAVFGIILQLLLARLGVPLRLFRNPATNTQ